MNMTLPDGIPLENDYRALLKADCFQVMEQFSDKFLAINKVVPRGYRNKWVEDPLHQWSRQWEYPFVFSRVEKVIKCEPRARILDAGSGMTFFPYYIKSQFDHVNVCCCDYDENLSRMYEQINTGMGNAVDFSVADLRSLPYEDDSFNMVYCVSVLEHTADYETIIEELYRILIPGGELVITFDVSLDGTRDISVEEGTELLIALTKRLDNKKNFPLDLKSHISASGIFTTNIAQGINAALLPWKYPAFLYRIKSLIKSGSFGTWPPPLTVFCLHLVKSNV